jgi:hypothetical protein
MYIFISWPLNSLLVAVIYAIQSCYAIQNFASPKTMQSRVFPKTYDTSSNPMHTWPWQLVQAMAGVVCRNDILK